MKKARKLSIYGLHVFFSFRLIVALTGQFSNLFLADLKRLVGLAI
jgi:hypothetical protein